MTTPPRPSLPSQFIYMAACLALAACGGAGNAPGPQGAGSLQGAGSVLVAGASGALWADGVTRPAGASWLGAHLWVSDNLEYFVRIDPAASGIGQTDQFFRATGLAGGADTSGPTAPHLLRPGQPAFDSSQGFVYVPDFANKGSGVWRFAFDAAGERVVSAGTILAPAAGMGGLRPTATALGPDGNLYVGSLNTPDVKRVVGPASASQTVQTIGKATGRRIFALAFLGSDLYLAEDGGLSVIRGATRCQSGCNAVAVPGVAAVETTGLAAANADTLYFIQAPTVLQYTASTGASQIFASQGTLPAGYTPATSRFSGGVSGCTGSTCSFTFAAGQTNLLALDGNGGLIVGEDPGTLTAPNPSPFCGRLWRF